MFGVDNPVDAVRRFLESLGLHSGALSWLSTVILVMAVGLLAVLSYGLIRFIIIRVFRYILMRSRTIHNRKFLETKMFRRLALIVPGLVVYYAASWLLVENPGWQTFIHKSSAIYIVLFISLSLTAFVEGWHKVWQSHSFAEGRSIKPYVQVVKLLIALAGVLIMISILFRVELSAVFAGLGVATAVLLLIFKDTLLGLVASIQLSASNMVSLGDWITIPARNVDGTVTDMSLYTIKVENFDKTILTVPTYALVSESFQNWKGMTASGVRRIKREIWIDVRSIAFLTPELADALAGIPWMEEWREINREELEVLKSGGQVSLTNLGAWRAYMAGYLQNHEDIDNMMPVMVRVMPPGESGLPVEIYCFSRINAWVPYEGVQSKVVEYAYATVSRFGLKLYQRPAGSDFENIAAVTNK